LFVDSIDELLRKSEKGEMDTPRKTFCVWPLTDIFVSDEDDYDKNVTKAERCSLTLGTRRNAADLVSGIKVYEVGHVGLIGRNCDVCHGFGRAITWTKGLVEPVELKNEMRFCPLSNSPKEIMVNIYLTDPV